jgi:hypothetical protein
MSSMLSDNTNTNVKRVLNIFKQDLSSFIFRKQQCFSNKLMLTLNYNFLKGKEERKGDLKEPYAWSIST